MKEENNTQTALFVGSFDPFTIGHADIVDRTLKLFGRIVIGVGINPEKHYMLTAEDRINAIKSLYEGDNRVKTVGFNDLAVDLAQREKANFIVKGVRSVKDFEYEREQAELNRRMTGYCCMLTLLWQQYHHLPYDSWIISTKISAGCFQKQRNQSNKLI